MTRAVAQEPRDIVLTSSTESQEQLDHAVSENWKDPFIPAAEKEAEEKAAKEAAEKAALEKETPEDKAARETAETEQHEETPEERAQRIADEAEPVKGNWSKRVNKLTARNARISEELRTEREARERLEARLSALERGDKSAPPNDAATPSASPDLPGKPKRIEFKDEETYVSALIKYERANEDYKEQVEAQNEHAKRIFGEHAARVDEARDNHEDWNEVAKSAEDMILPPAVDFAIREMPNSAEVLYYLAKHREEFERLSALSPLQMAIACGRISDRLAKPVSGSSDGNGRPRKPRPAAPEPITPGGRRPTSQGKKLEDMDPDEYYRARIAQRAARRAN